MIFLRVTARFFTVLLLVWLFCCCWLFNALPLYAQQPDPDCATLPPSAYTVCDNFTGTIGSNWAGDLANFTLTADQLQTNGPGVTGTELAITHPATGLLGATTWSFWANPKLATSSGNFIDVYLVADTSNLLGTGSGYVVRIGGTPDEISLFRKDAGKFTAIIDGLDGLLASNSDNPVRIKVNRSAAGLWTLERDYGISGNYTTEGSITDLTYTTCSYFGIYVKYSSANNTKYFLDDVFMSALEQDTAPPQLLNAQAQNANLVLANFNEPLEANSAQNLANWNGFASAALLNPDNALQVQLTPATPLTNGNYTLTATNISDLKGNIAAAQSVSFTYFAPLAQSIIITEIMADPDPPVALPNFEYIEIYNTTDADIPLNTLRFADQYPITTGGFLPNVLLLPKQYAIICKTGDAATALAQYGIVAAIPDFPSINNTGESLYLTDLSGNNLIDQANFTDKWYNDTNKDDGGYAIERIKEKVYCESALNWAASLNDAGGTPGAANSVANLNPDETAPSVISINVVGGGNIELVFSETLSNLNVADNANYTLSQDLTVTNVSYNNASNTAILYLNTPPQTGNIYTLTIGYARDCFGNEANNLAVQLAVPQPAAPFDVLISEIYVDLTPPYNVPELDLPASAYLELYNRSTKPINLQGWILRDAIDTTYLPAYLLLPNAYVLVCSASKTGLFTQRGLPVIGLSPAITFNVDGDDILLQDANGQLIHNVSYNKSFYHDAVRQEGGWSLELIDPNNPCAGADNWTASTAVIGGTPGEKNATSGVNPDEKIPVLLRAEAINNKTVQLIFNEPLDRMAAAQPTIYTIDGGIGQPKTVQMPATDAFSVILTLNMPLQTEQNYLVTVFTATDCAGNQAQQQTAKLALTQLAQPGDIVINELLFNPLPYGSDYVELYNTTSNKAIQLADWYIANADVALNPDSLIDVTPLTKLRYTLYPEEYVLLAVNIENIKTKFGLCKPNLGGNFIETALPIFDDAEGVVAITDLFGTVVLDKIHYNDNWQSPLITNPQGVALERIDVFATTQDANNWQSAAAGACNGTPGYANSQQQPNDGNNTPADEPLTISPAAFSPNNDGYNDYAQITLVLDEPGYTGNVYLFDTRGRTVRHLARNEQLSPNNFIKWDGSTDAGTKAPTGIYIVYAEVFKPNGTVRHYKKSVVVADYAK